MNRSESPPTVAENAIDFPSGDHVGLRISPTSGTSISRTTSPSATSRIASTALPACTPPTTNCRLSGLHDPAEPMNCRLVKCEFSAVSTSLRTMRPVVASARYRSIENRSRDEKKTMWRPSGLIDGDTLVAISRLVVRRERAPERVRARGRAHHGRVLRADVGVPVGRELFVVDERGLLERHDRIARTHRGSEDLADHVVAVLAADVRPDGLSPPIGEELGRCRGRRSPAALPCASRRAATWPCADRRARSRDIRPALRRTRAAALRCRRSRRRPAASPRRNVVLECMYELVAEHMVGFGERAGQRQHDPPLQSFGDAARALANHAADHVGLLEVGVRGVEDERLASLHLVLEDAREPRVPALGHAADARRVLRALLHRNRCRSDPS